MTKEQMMTAIQGGQAQHFQLSTGWDDHALVALRGTGVPRIFSISMEGHCVRTIDDLPRVVGSYPTVRHGRLDRFERSSLAAGDEIDYEGTRYVVAHNFFSGGNAATPDRHEVLIVPMAALAAA